MSHREHGTRAKYTIDRCRCDECREASRLYNLQRRNDLQPRLVSAEQARQHVLELMAAGVGCRQVARLAGLSTSAVKSIIWGKPGRPPTRRIKPSTAEALLSVTASLDDLADGTRIPAGPTHAGIAKLTEAGVPRARIAERLGVRTFQVSADQTHVTARAARVIAGMVAELDAGTLVTHRDSRYGPTVIAPEARPRSPRTITEVEEIDAFINEMADIILDKAAPWRAQAACRGDERPLWMWFPGRGDMKTQRKAQAICQACPVADECREYALRHRVREGMWGNLTGRQRRDLRPASIPCRVCGTEFTQSHGQEVYCGDDCRKQAHRDSRAASYRRRASQRPHDDRCPPAGSR